MNYIDFKWTRDPEENDIKGSPLNSFVFFWEKEKTSYISQSIPIALVLPKIQSRTEILVQINSCQAYEVVDNELIALEDNHFLEQVKLMTKILAQYFKYQNYLVLYSDVNKTKLISSIYVYSPRHTTSLKKYKIDKTDNTVKNLREDIPFRLEID